MTTSENEGIVISIHWIGKILSGTLDNAEKKSHTYYEPYVKPR